MDIRRVFKIEVVKILKCKVLRNTTYPVMDGKVTGKNGDVQNIIVKRRYIVLVRRSSLKTTLCNINVGWLGR